MIFSIEWIKRQQLSLSERKTCLSPPVIHYWSFQCGGFVVGLCCLFWCQSFGDVSPYVCSYHFQFGLGC